MGSGRPLLIESPTYCGAILAATQAGVRVVPVPSGPSGPDTEDLARAFAETGARVFYAQPAYANPTGAQWSLERAEQVLEIVRSHGAFLVEDDWAHDFGIDSTAQPLAAHDDAGHVVYLRSLTKTVSPSIRIAAVVARGPALHRILADRAVESMYVSGLLQAAALDVVMQPGWTSHLRNLRQQLRARRDLLVESLAEHVPCAHLDHVPPGGLNLWARLPDCTDLDQLARDCESAGVTIAAGTEWFPAEPSGPFIRLNYSGPNPSASPTLPASSPQPSAAPVARSSTPRPSVSITPSAGDGRIRGMPVIDAKIGTRDGRDMPVHHVVVPVFDGVQPLDVVGPHEVFMGATELLDDEGYRVSLVSAGAGPVRADSGMRLLPDGPLPDGGIDTVLVPGGYGARHTAPDDAVVAWLRAVAPAAQRTVSVCTGAFLLAAAGLLDGLPVTTHWRYARALAGAHPAVDVHADAIWLRSGRVWTSAGVTAGIDLALAIVEADHGPEIAQRIARELVVFLRRPGGQSQFAGPVWTAPARQPTIRAAQDLIHADPTADLRVPVLAARVGMS